jgi:hypothetical protein
VFFAVHFLSNSRFFERLTFSEKICTKQKGYVLIVLKLLIIVKLKSAGLFIKVLNEKCQPRSNLVSLNCHLIPP